jgi:hypothetical protein
MRKFTKKLTKFVDTSFIFALPIFYLAAYLILGVKRGAFYWTGNQDPDYAYLGNSLKLAMFQAPSHTDHPGTPLQIIGAVLISVWHFFQGGNSAGADLATDVLSNPETYLYVIHTGLVILTAGSILFLGMETFKICRNLPLSMVIQSSPFVMIRAHLVSEPSRVSPDVLVFLLSQFLSLLLVKWLFQKEVGESKRWQINLGIIFGLGMASKITFLPMIWFFLLIKGTKQKIVALLVAIAAFCIATLPIVSHYPRMLGWYSALATHTGPYKTGEQGLFNPTKIWKDLDILWSIAQPFIILLIITTIISITMFLGMRLGRERLKFIEQSFTLKRASYLLFLVSIAGWTQVLLALTERARSRYLAPSLGLAGFMLFALSLCLIAIVVPGVTRRNNGLSQRLIAPRLGFIALCVCGIIGTQQVSSASVSIGSSAKTYQADLVKVAALYQSQPYRQCLKVSSKRASTIESSLLFMNDWSGGSFSQILDRLYPQFVAYDKLARQFQSYSQPIPAQKVYEQSCTLLIGEQSLKKLKIITGNRKLKEIYQGKAMVVYQLKKKENDR